MHVIISPGHETINNQTIDHLIGSMWLFPSLIDKI